MSRPMSFRSLVAACSVALAAVSAGVPVPQAQAAANQSVTLGPSGLPLPRFVSLKSGRVNSRVGPGVTYAVDWMYLKAGLPMEIIQEFDNWRKVRDSDGSEGWVNQSLLSGKRTAMMAPWKQGQTVPLFDAPGKAGALVAQVSAGVVADVSNCTGDWCEITAGGYDGWVEQTQLWGVYPGEAVD